MFLGLMFDIGTVGFAEELAWGVTQSPSVICFYLADHRLRIHGYAGAEMGA